MVTAQGDTDTCSKCEGTGQAIDSGLPCINCRGKWVVRKGG
jgi:DnaJ-class molecular chaperone